MEWNMFLVLFGLLVGLVESIPMDMDSIKDGIQMGAMAGVGMAMDLAEKAKAHGSFDEKISLGPIKMEKKFNAGAGIMSDDSGSSEEDRKRRRRSVDFLIRSKRSPCFGRRRYQQQTTAAPAGGGAAGGGAAGGGAAGIGAGGGAGGAGAGAGGGTGAGGIPGAGGAGTGAGGIPGAGAGGGAGIPGTNPDDLPRRRRRSADNEDNDFNENIIPSQNALAQRAQEIGEKIRQLMKNMIDAVAGAFENLKKSMDTQ